MPAATSIHPLALIEPGAQLGERVRVGPFCHVGADVVLEDDVELISHVVVAGVTRVGAGTKVFPQASLGLAPQNTKHKGGPTRLVIGKNCTIRESVTMHTGTDSSRGETIVGDNGNFLAYAHVAHDCVVGRIVTFATVATLAGHCEIGDFVIIGGLTAIHQFVRVGHHAFIGGCSAVSGDVIPYGMAAGNYADLRGFNIVGLKRSGMPRADIHTLRAAYRVIFDRAAPLTENIKLAREQFPDSKPVGDVLAFLDTRDKRHFCVPMADGLKGGEGDDER